MSRQIESKKNASNYGLGEVYIPTIEYTPQYGQIMIANEQSKGGLMVIQQSKGKKIIGISGGHKKLFIFEEENQNVVTALHPENEDYLEYKGEEVLPIHELVLALEGNKINQIRSGKEHNIIMTEQGTLYAFGKGNFGSLGLGGTVFAAAPKLIAKLSNKRIVSIACGMYHSLALSDIGDVYSWGRGFEGQLGQLHEVQSISSPHFIPHFFKYNSGKDVKMLQKIPIVAIACGSYHSIAIDNANQVYCWGQARYGQTGHGKKTKQPIPEVVPIEYNGERKKIVKVGGGFGHTLCLTSDGDIFSWGLNIKGQLGLNDLPENIKNESEAHLNYMKAGYTPSWIKEGRDRTPLPKFKEIACGFTSSFAIDVDGRAWAWGGGCMGFKDKFSERGPVMLEGMAEGKRFARVYANDASVVWFCPLSPLYFKPGLVPSSGKTEITFFGNGFVETGRQCVRFLIGEQRIEEVLEFDARSGTFFCRAPVFEKAVKGLSYPLLVAVEVSLDGSEFLPFQKPLLVYSSKLQIQSIEPSCGSVLGGGVVRLFMPMAALVLEYIQNITVGFKSTSAIGNERRVENNQDWICAQGVYSEDTITSRIPNVPHFDQDNPFYMLDVSLNGQDFTELPHTFRYYLITDAKITPCEGPEDVEQSCRIAGQGLFDAAGKQLKVLLEFGVGEMRYNCERSVELRWNKGERVFEFTMPKLSWVVGDHELKPEVLEEARKHPCVLSLWLGKRESVEVGRYVYTAPPPPPEPEEDKKDAKKDAKKGAKK